MSKNQSATDKKAFLVYKDLDEVVLEMTDEQAGILFKSFFIYHREKVVPEVPSDLRFLLKSIVQQFKRDEDKYTAICAKRSDAGRLGAKQKLAKGGKRKHKLASEADTEKDTDTDIEKDINSLPAEAVRMADLIIEHVRSLNPKAKNITSKLKHTRLAWATDVERLNRLDSKAWDEIEAVFLWASADSFWRTNILSASKLRTQFDTLVIKKDGGEVELTSSL